MDFNVSEINSNLTKLLFLNHKYPRSFSQEEFHDVIQSLDETAAILSKQLMNEYLGAMSVARQIGTNLDFLEEIKRDEIDAQKVLMDISKMSRELTAMHDMMIAENSNLKDEQAILGKVRTGVADKITRVLSGGDVINEASLELLGKPFGDLYASLSSKQSNEELKQIIESAKQVREQELKKVASNG